MARKACIVGTALFLLLSSGCGGGIALFWSLVGGGSSGNTLPVAEFVRAPAMVDSPDEIGVLFTVKHAGDSDLAARVEFVEVDDLGNEIGLHRIATALPTSDDVGRLIADRETHFLWDARTDLEDRKAVVRILVTPMAVTREGKTVRSDPVRAGNTPATIDNFQLFSRGDELTATFELRDAEGDSVDVVDVALRFGDGEFVSLPPDFIKKLPLNQRRGLATTVAGDPSTLRVGLRAAEDHPIEWLAGIASRGFVGTVCLRVCVQDYATEEPPSSAEDSAEFDTTAAPIVQLLQPRPGATTSGIVPIHFRLFDPEKDPREVNVHFEVDVGDGFQPALEFALRSSEGRRVQTLQLPEDPMSAPFHTFLWDAQAQLRGHEDRDVEFRVWASDLVSGNAETVSLVIPRPEFAEIRTFTAPRSENAVTGDFNGDGFEDLFVQGYRGDEARALFFAGGPGGLTPGEPVAGISERDPDFRADEYAAVADFDHNGFDDIALTILNENAVLLLAGGPEGLRISDELTGIAAADMVALGPARGGQDRPALAVALPETNETQIFRVADGRLQSVQSFPCECRPQRLASDDLDHDGDADLVMLEDAGVWVYRGSPAEGKLEADELYPVFLPVVPARQTGRRLAPVLGEFDGDVAHMDVVLAPEREAVIVLSGTARGLERFATHQYTSGIIGDGIAVDVNADSSCDLVVPSSGGASSPGLLHFFLGSPQGLQNKSFHLDTSQRLSQVALVDLDGDGYPELVVPVFAFDGGSSSEVALFRGEPNGALPGDSLTIGMGPGMPVRGDFDRNGVAEAVVTHREESRLSYIGARLSDLRLLSSVPLVRPGPAPNFEPRQPLSADFDADGFPDVFVRGHPNTVAFIRGPDFQESLTHTLDASDGRLQAATVWDSDGDGVPEVVLAQKNVVLLGLTDGALRVEDTIATGTQPIALLSADVDGDGRLDLLVAHAGSRDIAIIAPTASGTPEVTQRIALDRTPTAFLAADLNADGLIDLAVAVDDGSAGSLRFVPGTDDGFDDAVAVPGGERRGSSTLVAGDFNGDGFLDLALANTRSDSVSLYRGSTDGPLHLEDVDVPGPPRLAAVADFTGDGFSDLAVDQGGRVTWLSGGPSGLELRDPINVGVAIGGLAVADLDGDGLLDLAITDRRSDELTVLRGRASGLRPPVEFRDRFTNIDGDPRIFANPATLLLTDVTGDGKKDVVVGNRDSTIPSLTILQQIDFSPRRTTRIAPSPDTPEPLEDFRSPPRFRLELPPNAFTAPTPVSILLTPTFDLPHGGAFERGRYLTVVTQPVRILRATTEVSAPAHLTLLLRDRYPFDDDKLLEQILENPERLRVIRLDEETGRGVALDVPAADLEIVELGEGTGARFPVERFGSYTVVYEREI